MIKSNFITSVVSCGYSILSVFSWRMTANENGPVRALWWLFTVIIGICLIIAIGIWLGGSNEKD